MMMMVIQAINKSSIPVFVCIFNVLYYVVLDDSPIFMNNAARLSEESNLHSEFDLQLTRDCGDDLICKPWLVMTLKALDR